MAVRANRIIADVLQMLGAAESAEDTLRTELQTAVGYLYAKRSDAVIGMCAAMSLMVTKLM